MHTLDRQAEQLAQAGIAAVPAPDLGWAQADVDRFGLADPFVLLVPGGAAHRPAKRWPADRYRMLAKRLLDAGATPVLIGGPGERDLTALIALGLDGVRDLAGETGLSDLVVLSRRAAAAVGNDTGPMHMAAASGCPSVVLYSAESDPALCAQRGPDVTILRREHLADLAVGDVLAALPPTLGLGQS
jgi:ADP-heptose:LPS heptosyltransferase